MNNLPGSTRQQDNSASVPPVTPTGAGGGAKEKEAGGIGSLELPLRDVSGQEIELPREVASAGVKVRPTTVSLPTPVTQLGVKPSGSSVPLGTGTTVVLPLSDEQIVVGLHQSLASSWRWLAEWCLRRLKQLHLVLKSVHGKFIRVKQ